MIYSLEGQCRGCRDGFCVISTSGVGYKVFMRPGVISRMASNGEDVHVWCHTHVVEGESSLYGFLKEEELVFFELLISVSGVGPKSAFSLLEIADIKAIAAAIKEERPDLLSSASGIGKKTAERIIVELKTKVQSLDSERTVSTMTTDTDILDTLVSLGYRKDEAKAALSKMSTDIVGISARLKEALRILSSQRKNQ